MTVDIDKSRRNDQTGNIHALLCLRTAEITDRRYAITGNSDICAIPGIAGAIHDASASKDHIECLGEEQAQR